MVSIRCWSRVARKYDLSIPFLRFLFGTNVVPRFEVRKATAMHSIHDSYLIVTPGSVHINTFEENMYAPAMGDEIHG